MFIIGIASPYVLACCMFMKMHTVHILYMPTEWMGKLYQRLEAASVVVPWTAIINYDIISVLVAWQPASAAKLISVISYMTLLSNTGKFI